MKSKLVHECGREQRAEGKGKIKVKGEEVRAKAGNGLSA
jgi:hypothetical protein